MQGTRCYTGKWSTLPVGGYTRYTDEDTDEAANVWIIRDPQGKLGTLRTHSVVEHEDGTVTVSPSILNPDPGGYHGWLERGVWRSA